MIRIAVEARLPDHCRLVRASNHGRKVWAAQCDRNRSPHRYTLTDGTTCWDWWLTLADAKTMLLEVVE